MVIAVAVVDVVQMAIDHVVHVVSVGNALMTAARTMHVAAVVPAASVGRGAVGPVVWPDRDDVLVDMVTVNMVEVAVVQIVRVPLVFYDRVAATWTVGVRMRPVCVVLGHPCSLLSGGVMRRQAFLRSPARPAADTPCPHASHRARPPASRGR